jgi:hypothetical protein
VERLVPPFSFGGKCMPRGSQTTKQTHVVEAKVDKPSFEAFVNKLNDIKKSLDGFKKSVSNLNIDFDSALKKAFFGSGKQTSFKKYFDNEFKKLGQSFIQSMKGTTKTVISSANMDVSAVKTLVETVVKALDKANKQVKKATSKTGTAGIAALFGQGAVNEQQARQQIASFRKYREMQIKEWERSLSKYKTIAEKERQLQRLMSQSYRGMGEGGKAVKGLFIQEDSKIRKEYAAKLRAERAAMFAQEMKDLAKQNTDIASRIKEGSAFRLKVVLAGILAEKELKKQNLMNEAALLAKDNERIARVVQEGQMKRLMILQWGKLAEEKMFQDRLTMMNVNAAKEVKYEQEFQRLLEAQKKSEVDNEKRISAEMDALRERRRNSYAAWWKQTLDAQDAANRAAREAQAAKVQEENLAMKDAESRIAQLSKIESKMTDEIISERKRRQDLLKRMIKDERALLKGGAKEEASPVKKGAYGQAFDELKKALEQMQKYQTGSSRSGFLGMGGAAFPGFQPLRQALQHVRNAFNIIRPDLEAFGNGVKQMSKGAMQGLIALKNAILVPIDAFKLLLKVAGNVVSGLKTILKVLGTVAATAVAAFAAMSAMFKNLATGVIISTDKIRSYEIGLMGMVKTQTGVNEIMEKSFKIAKDLPVAYDKVYEATKAFALIGPIREMLMDASRTEDVLKSTWNIALGLSQIEPEWGISGAIFSLREAMSGDLLSLKRRFEIPVNLIMTADGKPLREVKNDPEQMLPALERYITSMYDEKTLKMASRQFGSVLSKIQGEMTKTQAAIGKAGFYDYFMNDLIKIQDAIMEFTNSDSFAPFVKKISDDFIDIYNSIKEIATEFQSLIERAFGDSQMFNDLPNALEKISSKMAYIYRVIKEIVKDRDLQDRIFDGFRKGGKVIEDIFSYVKELIGSIVTDFQKAGAMIKPLIQDLSGIFGDFTEKIDNVTVGKGLFYYWFFGGTDIVKGIKDIAGDIKRTVENLILSLTNLFLGTMVALSTTIGKTLFTFTAAIGAVAGVVAVTYESIRKNMKLAADYLYGSDVGKKLQSQLSDVGGKFLKSAGKDSSRNPFGATTPESLAYAIQGKRENWNTLKYMVESLSSPDLKGQATEFGFNSVNKDFLEFRENVLNFYDFMKSNGGIMNIIYGEHMDNADLATKNIEGTFEGLAEKIEGMIATGAKVPEVFKKIFDSFQKGNYEAETLQSNFAKLQKNYDKNKINEMYRPLTKGTMSDANMQKMYYIHETMKQTFGDQLSISSVFRGDNDKSKHYTGEAFDIGGLTKEVANTVQFIQMAKNLKDIGASKVLFEQKPGENFWDEALLKSMGEEVYTNKDATAKHLHIELLGEIAENMVQKWDNGIYAAFKKVVGRTPEKSPEQPKIVVDLISDRMTAMRDGTIKFFDTLASSFQDISLLRDTKYEEVMKNFQDESNQGKFGIKKENQLRSSVTNMMNKIITPIFDYMFIKAPILKEKQFGFLNIEPMTKKFEKIFGNIFGMIAEYIIPKAIENNMKAANALFRSQITEEDLSFYNMTESQIKTGSVSKSLMTKSFQQASAYMTAFGSFKNMQELENFQADVKYIDNLMQNQLMTLEEAYELGKKTNIFRSDRVKALADETNRLHDLNIEYETYVDNMERQKKIIDSMNFTRMDDLVKIMPGIMANGNREVRNLAFTKYQTNLENSPRGAKESFNTGIASTLSEFKNWSELMYETGATLATDLNSAFEDSFFNTMKGSIRNIGDMFKNVADVIKDTLLRVLAKIMAMSAINLVFGISFNQNGGFNLSNLFGGGGGSGGLLTNLFGNLFGGGSGGNNKSSPGGIISTITDIAAGGGLGGVVSKVSGGMGGLITASGGGGIGGIINGAAGATLAKSASSGTGLLGGVAKWAQTHPLLALGAVTVGNRLFSTGGLFSGSRVDHTGEAKAAYADKIDEYNQRAARKFTDAEKYYASGMQRDLISHQFAAPAYWETKSGDGIFSKKTKTGHYDTANFYATVYSYYEKIERAAQSHYKNVLELERLKVKNSLAAAEKELGYAETAYHALANEYIRWKDSTENGAFEKRDEFRDKYYEAGNQVELMKDAIKELYVETDHARDKFEALARGASDLEIEKIDIQYAIKAAEKFDRNTLEWYNAWIDILDRQKALTVVLKNVSKEISVEKLSGIQSLLGNRYLNTYQTLEIPRPSYAYNQPAQYMTTRGNSGYFDRLNSLYKQMSAIKSGDSNVMRTDGYLMNLQSTTLPVYPYNTSTIRGNPLNGGTNDYYTTTSSNPIGTKTIGGLNGVSITNAQYQKIISQDVSVMDELFPDVNAMLAGLKLDKLGLFNALFGNAFFTAIQTTSEDLLEEVQEQIAMLLLEASNANSLMMIRDKISSISSSQTEVYMNNLDLLISTMDVAKEQLNVAGLERQQSLELQNSIADLRNEAVDSVISLIGNVKNLMAQGGGGFDFTKLQSLLLGEDFEGAAQMVNAYTDNKKTADFNQRQADWIYNRMNPIQSDREIELRQINQFKTDRQALADAWLSPGIDKDTQDSLKNAGLDIGERENQMVSNWANQINDWTRIGISSINDLASSINWASPLEALQEKFYYIKQQVMEADVAANLFDLFKGFESQGDVQGIIYDVRDALATLKPDVGIDFGIPGLAEEMKNLQVMNDLSRISGGFLDEMMSGEDPWEVWFNFQKETILERIKTSKEGEEDFYTAHEELFALMTERAEHLKQKAEESSKKLEEALGKIEETLRLRVAEEKRSLKGDVVFIDAGKTRDTEKLYEDLIARIKTGDPAAREMLEELKRKIFGTTR